MENSTSGWDRKNDRVILVTFNADGSFEFSCDSTTMKRRGDIVLQRDSDNATWTFVSVNKLKKPPFTCTLAPGGTSVTITNDHTEIGEYRFTVTVQDSNGPHTSPDDERDIVTTPPMIRNL